MKLIGHVNKNAVYYNNNAITVKGTYIIIVNVPESDAIQTAKRNLINFVEVENGPQN